MDGGYCIWSARPLYRRNATTPAALIASASSSSMCGENVGVEAAGSTVIDDVLLLFVAFGSVVDDETDAVFESGPDVEGNVRRSAIVADDPFAIAPRLQVIIDEPLHIPCVGVAATSVVPAGSVSVTLTRSAVPGPEFVTTIE